MLFIQLQCKAHQLLKFGQNLFYRAAHHKIKILFPYVCLFAYLEITKDYRLISYVVGGNQSDNNCTHMWWECYSESWWHWNWDSVTLRFLALNHVQKSWRRQQMVGVSEHRRTRESQASLDLCNNYGYINSSYQMVVWVPARFQENTYFIAFFTGNYYVVHGWNECLLNLGQNLVETEFISVTLFHVIILLGATTEILM